MTKISNRVLATALTSAGFVQTSGSQVFTKDKASVDASKGITLTPLSGIETPFGKSHSPAMTQIGGRDHPVIAYSANGEGNDLTILDSVTAAATVQEIARALGGQVTWHK